jgi:type II secretory pathway pseudopilin PulG
VAPPRAEAGFTLVEALCAIVILAFGLMAIANLMAVAASSNTVANQSTAATALASQQMEILKNIPFTNPGTNVFNPALNPGGNLEADVAGYFTDPPTDVPGVGQVRVRWRITGVPDPLAAGVMRGVFIEVRAEGMAPLVGVRSRAEFTTFRSCADSDPTGLNCP